MAHFIEILGGRLAIRFAGSTERMAEGAVLVDDGLIYFDTLDDAADALAVAMLSGGITHTLCGQGVYNSRFDIAAFGGLVEAKLVEAGVDFA